MPQLNTASDISSLALAIQEDAIFVERSVNFIQNLVTVYRDASGVNTRKNFQYGTATVNQVAETDDLSSQAFAPALLNTLTPYEYGAQFFITDLRAETDSPDNIRTDGARELGFGAAAKVESDVLGLFPSLTGGTVGASGTAMTWGLFFAAATRARVSVKNQAMPLYAVLHEYQWHAMAKAVSPAASTLITNTPAFSESIIASWYKGRIAGVEVFVTPNSAMLSGTDAYGAVFARDAIALDWRRPIRVEGERDASRRGMEMNLSMVYAKGVWRPTFGVQILTDCQAPSS